MTSSLARYIENFSRVLNMAAGVCLFILMMIVAVDVLLRYIFNAPLMWAYEAGSLLMVPIVFLALAWTQAQGGHVRVGLLVDRMGPRVRSFGYFFTSLVALPFFMALTWQTWLRAWKAWEVGQASMGLYPIPFFPFMVTIPLGGLAISLQLVVGMLRQWRSLTGSLAP
jgi:TRAP-type C4-dicarboxylate transport system permease small subunit